MRRARIMAFNRVKNSRDTCLLWVSGLNSADMQRANAMSTNTPDRRRSLRLVAVDEPAARRWRGGDDRPLYRFEPINAGFGSYDNLIDPERDPQTGASRPGSVEVPVVDAVIYAREEALAALGERGPQLVRAVEDAGPAIWARVSPPVGGRPPRPSPPRLLHRRLKPPRRSGPVAASSPAGSATSGAARTPTRPWSAPSPGARRCACTAATGTGCASARTSLGGGCTRACSMTCPDPGSGASACEGPILRSRRLGRWPVGASFRPHSR